ncbi:hypothetical protein GCM10027567_18650 [Spongiibacter taiwanensis]
MGDMIGQPGPTAVVGCDDFQPNSLQAPRGALKFVGFDEKPAQPAHYTAL